MESGPRRSGFGEMVRSALGPKLLTDLSGKVALVTGGSRGIGRAIAIRLAQGGAQVVFNYKSNHEAATEALTLIKASGSEVFMVIGDVSVQTDVDQLVDAALKRFGRIDILVNNAGITLNQLLMRTSEEEMHAVLNTNLVGTMLMTKAVARGMTRQRYGRVVNITSAVGIMGNGGQSVYAASKAGLIGFTRSMARELASRKITVNAVAPGAFFTDIWDGVSEDHRKLAVAQIPLGSAGELEDVAEAVAFLASDAARYITGQVLNVDGGLVMG